jgi:TRAP-type C4-dicarboxylate transport system permease small subunit
MLRHIVGLLGRIEVFTMVFLISLLCLLIVLEIVLRSLFATGLSWLEEFSRYALVVGTFLGASIAVKNDEHPRMLALLQGLPGRSQHLVCAGRDIALGFFLLLLDYYGWLQVRNLMRIGTQASTMPVPLWSVYFIIPVSILVMAIRSFLCARTSIRAWRGEAIAKEAAP